VNEHRTLNPFRLTLLCVLLGSSLLQFAASAHAQGSHSETQSPWQESRASAAKGTRIKIPKILRSEVKANSEGCSEIAPEYPTKFDAYELRLKHGRLLVLWGRSYCLCGATGNCDFWVYHLRRGRGELLLKGDMMRDFGFLKATTNGLPDLVTWVHDSADRSPGKVWKFDGSNYIVQCGWEIVSSFKESSKDHWEVAEEHVEGNSCEGYDENGKRVTKN
jgi:hypothetical protein